MQRIYAARAAAKHLEIYTYLRDGELNVGVVALLAPHLTPANSSDLLGRARGKSKREIEALAVELSHARAEANRPRVEEEPVTQDELGLSFDEAASEPDSKVSPRIQETVAPVPEVAVEGKFEEPLPPPPTIPEVSVQSVEELSMKVDEHAPVVASESGPARATESAAPQSMEPSAKPAGHPVPAAPDPSPQPPRAQGSASASSRRDSIRLEAPGVLRVTFQAGVSFGEKLERVRGLLGRRNGKVASVLDVVLEDYLNRHDPSRREPRPRLLKERKSKRRASRWVRDIVWRRDGGRCAFISTDGVRCAARSRLEYDHIQPWALGGASDDPDNIRLLCRAHNLRAARKTFGDRVPAARLPSG